MLDILEITIILFTNMGWSETVINKSLLNTTLEARDNSPVKYAGEMSDYCLFLFWGIRFVKLWER